MKKKIARLAAVLLALFVSAMAFNLQRGVTVGETFLPKRSDALYQKNADYRVSLSHDGDKTLCDIRFGAETLSAALTWNGERVRIEYDDGTVVAGVWYPAEKWVMDEEGMPVIWSDGATVIVKHRPRRACQRIVPHGYKRCRTARLRGAASGGRAALCARRGRAALAGADVLFCKPLAL